MNILKEFGTTIRSMRIERGWSQEKLSFESDLHRTYIGAIERGEKNITLKNIKKLADTLEVPISELFK